MAIRRLPNGRWLARVFLDYNGPNGKRRDASKVFDDETEAKAWEVVQEQQKKRGEATTRTRESVRQYLTRWLDDGLVRRDVRERTRRGYAEDLRRYVLPNVPAVRLDQFGRRHVRMLAATLLKQQVRRGGKVKDDALTLSTTKVRHALAALSAAMGDAMDDGLIRENPVTKIRLPKRERTEGRWLDRGQVRALLDANRDDPMVALWGLLAFTGMRPGEALGLRWEMVDLDGASLRVEESLTPQKAAPGWTLTPPKTARSRRRIPLSAEVVRLLDAHRSRQSVERIIAGSAYEDFGAGGFVFSGPTGSPMREDGLARRLAATCARAKVATVTPYALRHTAASLMLAAGTPLVVVSRHLGHTTIGLTADTYSHLTSELQQQAVEQLSAYMAEAPKGSET
jgi:integrase